MERHDDWEDGSRADGAGGRGAPDAAPRITSFSYDAHRGITTYGFAYDAGPNPYRFEHLEGKGLFALTGPGGKTEYFRDKPIWYLVVEPDPETGEFAPVSKRRRPVFLWLCREEREVSP